MELKRTGEKNTMNYPEYLTHNNNNNNHNNDELYEDDFDDDNHDYDSDNYGIWNVCWLYFQSYRTQYWEQVLFPNITKLWSLVLV